MASEISTNFNSILSDSECSRTIDRSTLTKIKNFSVRDKIFEIINNRNRAILIIALILTFLLRLYLSLSTTFTWDEERDVVLTADKISANYLPLRGLYHSALSEYFVKLSSLIFGTSHTGYRMFSIIFGTLTVFIVYSCAKAAWSKTAALWVALLLAFNEYHINVSSLAIQKTGYLLFVTLGIYAFVLFILKKESRYLYLTTASVGIGFLCYELACLILPSCYLMFLAREHRHWLKRKEPYLAALLFFLIVSPDMIGSFLSASSGANYQEHLSRFGFGLTEQPITFYLFWGMWHTFGIESLVNDPFISRMNFIFGITITGCVLWAFATAKDPIVRFLLLLFGSVMVFLIVSKGSTTGRIDLSVAVWHWADLTLPSAILITGFVLSRIKGKWIYPVAVLLIMGGVSSIRSVISRFDNKRPEYAVKYSPEFSAPSKELIRVRAFFDFCDLCDKHPRIELMGIEHFAGDVVRPVSVNSARLGTDDREFYLQAEPDRYKITYRLTDSYGNKTELNDEPYDSIGVHLRPRAWQPVFWVR